MSYTFDSEYFENRTNNSEKIIHKRNNIIKKEYNIKTNEKYREFMTKHSNMIMERNMKEMTLYNNTPYYKQYNLYKTPYKFENLDDDTYNESFSDAKIDFLNKEKIQSMRIRPLKESI